ncbi:hypothetical protein [Bacillus thuringiensis]|uniref:hypothetical protein n=1 Tax=Bacillus thuringiensis TaxID=1428 RepID=UPI002079AA08|nr:hypothetical protein [Bacillus thuringiensis]USL16433.1 hypothetical protein LIT28_29130 [Bacillus thuringiensis]
MANIDDKLIQPEPGWKRFDDTHPDITYIGEKWVPRDAFYYYNETFTNRFGAADNAPATVQFYFKGTGIRIIAPRYQSERPDVKVEIDGVLRGTYKGSDSKVNNAKYQLLVHETLGLEDRIHEIKLSVPGGDMAIDAFDILGGTIVTPSKVGDKLNLPEPGWTRFDDSHELISYETSDGGTWAKSAGDTYYNKLVTYKTGSQNQKVKFKFKGTKIRLLGTRFNLNRIEQSTVLIDGVEASTKYNQQGTTNQYITLLFESPFLTDGEHLVEIVTSKDAFDIDAIDILGGSLVKLPAKVGEQLLQPEAGWTRVDDANPIISYIGTDWLLVSGDKASKYYNQTNKYRVATTSQGSVQFSFKGTGIRIVSTLYHNNEWPDVSVEIDSVPVGNYVQSKDLPNFINQVLLFEKTGLTDSMHSIKLTGTKMNMDAFDILGGDIVKNQPKQLLQPESGWTRINNSDASINAVGFITGTDSSNGLRNCYMNDHIYSKDSGTVTFEFTGTGLRVLGLAYSNYSNNIVIDIDGVKDTFSEDYLIVPEYMQGSMLVYEKLNLENKKHTVTIHNGDTTKGFGFDAFDIFKPTAKVGDKLTQPEAGWKRIDDTDSNIKYTGLWQGSGSANTGYYNDTMKYKNASVGSGLAVCEFSFTGTKLRVIGAVVSSSQYYKGPVTITIDGIAETYTMNNPNRNDRQFILYEKLNLSPGNHVVKIEAQENIVDAFDIDSNGSIGKPPVTVGDILLQPEDGWKRIEDSNSNFKYTGDGWATNSAAKWSGGSTHYCPNSDKLATVEFVFNGTKLRIIGLLSAGYREGQIWIDEQPVETINFEQPNAQYQSLVYEKLGLANGEHKVKLSGLNINFDAIDIDSDGSIQKPPAKVGDQLIQPEPGWKRIDNIDTNIQYIGSNWTSDSDSTRQYYNNTCHNNLNTDKSAQIKFNFKGTKLRLMCSVYENHSNKVAISIDGQVQYYSESRVVDRAYGSVLCYEKLGLTDAVHEVTIKCENPGALSLDAIDIDDNGSMSKPPFKVGDQLLQPEAGWKRIDDTDSSFKYVGDWWKSGDTTPEWFNNKFHYVDGASGEVQFQFSGTRLRIIGCIHESQYRSNDIKIIIDGQEEFYSEQATKVGYQTLVYEKLGLAEGVHDVVIKSGTNSPFPLTFDAIDIDSDGSIQKPPAKVGDILLQPESGWTRVDDTNPLIHYRGDYWELAKGGGYEPGYNKTATYRVPSYSNRTLGTVEFSFKGTGLRVISANSSQSSWEDVTIEIDGVTEKYKVKTPTDQDKTRYQVILYEKNLPNGVHTVKLTGTLMTVDAFDIKGGDLVETSTNLRDILFEPQPGWKRIDDTDSNIEYNGVWATSDADGRCYKNTIHYKHATSNPPADANPVSIKFNFTGTKLRIIGIGVSLYDPDAKVLIDGVEETINFFRPSGLTAIYQSLIYEKLGLSNKLHTVEIKGKFINLDAIDIDESGSIGGKSLVKIGDQLKQPEAGWKRLDGTDSLLKYQGTWEKGSSSDWYNGTYHYVADKDSTGAVEFDFYGTRLRIITCFDVASYRTDDISITIDGVTEKYSEIASAKVYQGLAYEKLGLTKGKHRVRIQCGTKGTYRLNIDAIDIDADGYIEKPPITVGDFLATPEDGWKRFTKENMYFDYTGGMDYQNQTPPIKYSFDKIQFRFFGTKFRLIYSSNLGSNEKQLGHVLIDGVKYPVNMFPVSGPAKIACEVLNLDEGYHVVTVNGGTHEGWDPQFIGIDIDTTGHIDRLPVSIGDISTYPNYGWKRYDDNATYIQYDANWSKNVAYNGAYGGKSTCAKKGKNASMVFRFKGTKLRLIVGCATKQYYSDIIRVKIDDLPEEDFDAIAPQDTNQVLKYEKLGLEDIEHDVTVTVITTQPGALEYDFRMDAIDIDDTGSLVSRPGVGTVLTEPEKGWKRIDDTDPLIRYIGNWKLTTGNDKHYNKTTHYNLDKKLDTSFEFEFVGTKLRLLAYGDSGYDATSKILIDGKEETMVYNSPSGNQVIRYEKIGLDRGKHTVKVIGKAMSLDSIDIDADGYLLARLGDQLVEPEPGWVRFDDTHKNIEYNGFWKTTEADVSCYNNTHHWKSKEDNNDSTISARFLFKGTKFRLISMTSPSYPEDIELKIDGQKEILKLSGEVMQYQTLAYEKKNLEDMIHVIELSGKYISIDAIDLEEGATLLKLPDEKLKPYQIRSGLIFKDDFDTFDSRWIASPVGSYSLIDRKGYFRMLHNVSRDTLLLADLPNEKEFAFEVSADYTPTHEDDKGGIIVWKNGEENIEFLETEDGTRETTELKWMACKDNEDWTFFSDYGEGFNFCDSDRMNCSKFGVVLKKGSNSKFINLDIDSIIATRGRKLTIANIAPNISVQMVDEFGGIIFNGNTGYNTGIQITLPSLEFTGKVILTNVEGKELGVIKTTFYGGDVYGFGSNLEIKFSGEELSTLAQTRLPDMISGKSEIMLELVNPSVARANNVNLSIAQYEDKFGWSWADLALDSNGKPGQYQDSINIPYVNPENTIKFWLKVTKGTDYVGLAPLQFQIHLEHE